ncbi:FecR family protein [Pedobacter fastidiosus]|uniref:FecR family protein n=1 Tax=Pedobacter fastidiosus TaxID=2765361 RepID=A0ABR7KUU3_9SPHI|nr:FecR family protein [Pedobacter fastidiosus]MBC6111882.1 FecR family protein [Pedobacter fastidiosus]
MEKDAKKLLNKYLSGNCTPQEKAVIEEWYLHTPIEKEAPSHLVIEESKEEVWGRITLFGKPRIFSLLKRAGIAASILICIAAGFYILKHNENSTHLMAKRELKDVLPGGNKAILTLANGRTVNLDDAKEGQIVIQNGVLIRKRKNGEIEYVVQAGATDISGTNTISTPRGGQYQVSLPDGTKVWLNAATTLKYPFSFGKSERLVELNGEAYFEVFKDKTRPFRVKTAEQTVEVLGTHFNINAYADEVAVKTTLLEGSVKVTSASTTVNIHPGEQSQLSKENNNLIVDKQVDLDKEMAWKNNIFSFDNDDLQTVMRQISRWYDIDVVYKGKIKDEKYVGEIPRSSNLSDVFEILELNHIHTDIKGKVLTISGTK